MTPYQVLLYYLYTTIEDPDAYLNEHRALCESLELRGRILIAHEGINGTVSGLLENTQRYCEALKNDPRTQDIQFKIDLADGHVFRKLSVKHREEIVTLNLGEDDIDPAETTAQHLSPKEFFNAMQDPETIILDGRNRYESELGRFQRALCPDVEHFRDFPDWIRQNLAHLKNRRILTYCTGGIRCEKLSGFLLKEGFKDVYQLDGGIVTYGRDEEVRGRDFEGQCYVFDERVVVEVNQVNPKVIAHCQHCGEPNERYRNCAYTPCNAQFFCCERCEENQGRYCSATCRTNDSGVVNDSPE